MYKKKTGEFFIYGEGGANSKYAKKTGNTSWGSSDIISLTIEEAKKWFEKKGDGLIEEAWTGDYVFENEWQSFRTKKDRTIELKSTFRDCPKGRRKIAIKVVDIFGNDTMKVIELNI